jgi:hypothetical protein
MPSHQDVPSYEKPSNDGGTKDRVQITGVVGSLYMKRQMLSWFIKSCHQYRLSQLSVSTSTAWLIPPPRCQWHFLGLAISLSLGPPMH